MGRIKRSLCFFKKQSKKLIFDPKITLRTKRSDTAQNPNFRAYLLNAAHSVVSFSATVERLKQFIRWRGESVD
jgi:hypothetical protein